VSTSTVRRWAIRGEIEAVRLGRGDLARIRIKESGLDDFVRPAAPDAYAVAQMRQTTQTSHR
jgi:excisionase family DNA binding protein